MFGFQLTFPSATIVQQQTNNDYPICFNIHIDNIIDNQNNLPKVNILGIIQYNTINDNYNTYISVNL